MIERLAKQLDNPNPRLRMRAIEGLAKQNDKRALTLLQAVSTRDPNGDVRKAAEKAGNDFRRRTGIHEAPKLPEKTKADPRIAARTKELLSDAMRAYSAGDYLRAAKALRKVLETNPALRKDTFTTSLIGSVTDLDGDEAINTLMKTAKLETIPGIAASIERMKAKAK